MVLVYSFCELWKPIFVKTKYKEDARHNKISANVGEKERVEVEAMYLLMLKIQKKEERNMKYICLKSCI